MQRSFTPIAGAAFALESALFAALSALLAHYESRFAMSTLGSGVLAGTYPAGMILGTLLAGLWTVDRLGVRSTALAGCVLLALASVAFGAAGSVATLDLSRSIQGVGAGLLWCSLLNWLILMTPPASRGSSLGAAIGASVLGAAAGPLLGAATQLAGTLLTFAAVGLAVLAYAVLLAGAPTPPVQPAPDSTPRLHLAPDPQLRWIAAVGFAPPVILGAVITIAPLQLAARGASDIGIDTALLLGALLSAAGCVLAGRLADRRGHLAPIVFGILASIATLSTMAAASSPLALSAGVVLFEGFGIPFFWIPLMSLFTIRAESAGMSAAAAALILNLIFTVASTLGPPMLAGLEQASSEAVPYLALAGLAVLGAVAISYRRGFAGLAPDLPAGEASG